MLDGHRFALAPDLRSALSSALVASRHPIIEASPLVQDRVSRIVAHARRISAVVPLRCDPLAECPRRRVVPRHGIGRGRRLVLVFADGIGPAASNEDSESSIARIRVSTIGTSIASEHREFDLLVRGRGLLGWMLDGLGFFVYRDSFRSVIGGDLFAAHARMRRFCDSDETHRADASYAAPGRKGFFGERAVLDPGSPSVVLQVHFDPSHRGPSAPDRA